MDSLTYGVVEIVEAMAVSTAAGVLRGTTGFGSSLILAPVLSHVLGPIEAVSISLLLGMSASAFLAPAQWPHVNLPLVGLTGLAGLICVIPGVILLRSVDPDIMRRAIALVTICAAALMFLAPRYEAPASPVPSLFAGALGGLIMGATSVGGPPIILYLIGRKGTASEKLANVVVVVGLLEAASLALLGLAGVLDRGILTIFAVLLPTFVVGMALGRRLFAFASDQYRPLVLITLIVVGAALLMR